MDRLIRDLKENYTDAWDNEWKLVTILIGRDDLCNQCEDSVSASRVVSYLVRFRSGLKEAEIYILF